MEGVVISCTMMVAQRGVHGCANLPISIELHQDQVCLVDGCVKVLLRQFEHNAFPKMAECLLFKHIVHYACKGRKRRYTPND